MPSLSDVHEIDLLTLFVRGHWMEYSVSSRLRPLERQPSTAESLADLERRRLLSFCSTSALQHLLHHGFQLTCVSSYFSQLRLQSL